jgi:hypothetical protein
MEEYYLQGMHPVVLTFVCLFIRHNTTTENFESCCVVTDKQTIRLMLCLYLCEKIRFEDPSSINLTRVRAQ